MKVVLGMWHDAVVACQGVIHDGDQLREDRAARVRDLELPWCALGTGPDDRRARLPRPASTVARGCWAPEFRSSCAAQNFRFQARPAVDPSLSTKFRV